MEEKAPNDMDDEEDDYSDEEEEFIEEEENIYRGDSQAAAEQTQEYWNIHKLVKLGALQVLEMASKHPATRIAVYQLGGIKALQDLLDHSDIELRGLSALVLARVCTYSPARNELIACDGLPVLVYMLKLKGSSQAQRAVEGAAKALWACSMSRDGQIQLMNGHFLDIVGFILPSSKTNILIPVVGILQRCFLQKGFRRRMEAAGHTTYLVNFLQSSSSKLQCLAAQALARAAILEATRIRLVSECGLAVVVKLLLEESRSFVSTANLHPNHPARKVSMQLVPNIAANEGASRRESSTAVSLSDQLTPTENPAGIFTPPVTSEEEARTLVIKSRPSSGPDEEAEFSIGESDLLEAVTGILWQVSMSRELVKQVHELGAVPVLIALLEYHDERVVTNVVGALGEIVTIPECCALIVIGEGVNRLLELLQRNSDKLLLNVTRALDSCARNGEALDQLLQQEGLRLLWSHLKSQNYKIQASAANAICTCLLQEKEGLAEVVRSLVGGIELLVALLESPCEAVLSSVCAAIARIAADPQNLAIMTDYGAVTCLSKLAVRLMKSDEIRADNSNPEEAKGVTRKKKSYLRENDTLRPYLAEAIAACCVSRETGLLFGQAGAVAPLVKYLETNDSKIRRPTCRALYRLSLEPENCVALHQSGAVNLLLEMLGSEDEVVQEAGAECLRNIRLLALQRCRDRDTQNDVFTLQKH